MSISRTKPLIVDGGNLLMLRWLLSVSQKHHGPARESLYLAHNRFFLSNHWLQLQSCSFPEDRKVVLRSLETMAKMLEFSPTVENATRIKNNYLHFHVDHNLPPLPVFKTSKQIALTDVFESLHPILHIAETWRLYHLTMAVCKQSTWSKSLNSSTFPPLSCCFPRTN